MTQGLERRIKKHIIAKEHEFFAIVQPGFEKTAAQELSSLGIEKFGQTIEGGIEFSGRINDCYRINICSRTLSRLLLRVSNFKAERFDILNKKISRIPWELYIKDGTHVSFRVKARKSRLYHTVRIEQECNDAVKSRLREYNINISGEPDTDKQVQEIFIRFENDRCTVSLDTGGGLLYKRGRKLLVSDAPIRETIASLILLEAGLEKYDCLIDPMCGSGTFSLEAMEISCSMPPNINRDFIFKKWPCFREAAFAYMAGKISEEIKSPEHSHIKIHTSDIDAEAVSLAQKNADNSGFSSVLGIEEKPFSETLDIEKPGKCLIVLNPPYGRRLSNTDSVSVYRKIGNTIRNKYAGCSYAIISPGVEYEKAMSLPYEKKILFMNGGIKAGVIFHSSSVLQ